MKKADAARLETLEALIAEKRRQETFLSKLEERRAGTPEHVFNRLRDEYLTKLTDAQVRAAAEAETLSGGLEDDDAAVAEVEARLAILEEERLETQLRAEVEEWDARETQKKLTAMTAAISMAEKERDARRAVAQRTRALVNEARGGTPAGPQNAVPGGPPPMRPTTAGMAVGPNFDELAFLNSVVGRSSAPSAPAVRDSKQIPMPAEARDIKESASAPNPAPAAAPRTPTPAPAPIVESPSARTAPITESPSAKVAPVAESPSAKPPAPVAEAPSAPAPVAPAAAPAVAPAAPVAAEPAALPVPPSPAPPPPPAAPAAAASAAAASAAAQAAVQPSLELEPPKPAPAPAKPAAVAPAAPAAPAADEEDEEDGPSSPLGRPTPRTSQQIKTLKCAECGSMNYPTEWYCERCGGELAAL